MFRNWLMLNKNWVLQNFPFLEDDFDALDDYALFCKFIGYVQKIAITTDKFYKELKDDLQEMYEDGKFDSLIEEIINLQVTFTFPNIATMKEATNLINNSYARTSGFYSYNDGGGSNYYVRTKTEEDTIDDVTIVGLSDETLVAELLIQDEMNVKEFGAKGDGETDDTLSIQKALDNCKNIIIDNGTYMIDSYTNIKPKSNSYIKLINATLKAITNNLNNYAIIKIDDVDNITIEGGTVEGDRVTHTSDSGEWGHCIHITGNSTNINLSNMILKNAWGDGLYINDATNINTQNIVYDNNRRQGISIIKVNGYHSLNDKIINTNGTAPQCGIDIEPNYTTDYIQNVLIENLYTENNGGAGIALYLINQDGNSLPISIKIINHHDKGSIEGERICINKLVRHSILTLNPLLENNNFGINMRDTYDNGIDKIQIIRPKIINCNYNTEITAAYVCGISCYTTETTEDSLGGFTIIEPFITSRFETNRAGFFLWDNRNNVKLTNVDIINPVNKQSNLRLVIYASNVTIKDIYNKYKYSGNSAFTLSYNEMYCSVTNTNFTASRTITLNQDVPVGAEITFINEKSSNFIKIQMSNTEYVRYFNDDTSNLISLNEMNSLITLKRVAENEWIVTNLVGDISV